MSNEVRRASWLLALAVTASLTMLWSMRGRTGVPNRATGGSTEEALSLEATRRAPAALRPPTADSAPTQTQRSPVEASGPRAVAGLRASSAAQRNTGALVSVEGTVRRFGAPVPDYDLSFRARHSAGQRDDDWEWTDSNGHYRVVLAPGSYDLTNDDDGPWLGILEVPSGPGELRFDIDLPEASIGGQVMGAPFDPRSEELSVIALRDVGSGMREPAGRVVAEANGHFELHDLLPGTYTLLAVQGTRQSAPHTVRITSGWAHASLAFDAGVHLVGRVVDRDRQPATMRLWFVPGDNIRSPAELDAAVTVEAGFDGRFELEAFPPGSYTVFGSGDTHERDLTLRQRVQLGGRAEPVLLLAEERVLLDVVVRDAAGSPVPGIRLEFQTLDGAPVAASLEHLVDDPATGALGTLRLYDVVPGHYRLSALGVRGIAATVEVRLTEGESRRIELRMPTRASRSSASRSSVE